MSPEALFVGVDCGGTNLRAVAADRSGRVAGETVTPTGDAQDRENGLGEAICALVADLARGLPSMSRIAGIGVGLPFVCHGGRAYLCRNVKSLDPLKLETALSAAHGARVAIMNDVKCAALGEAWMGAAKGADPFLFVNVGTGLSSALYSGGRVHMGAHNASGEIAYWVADAQDATGLAEGFGPLEEAMSGVGLSDTYERAAGLRLSAEEIFRRSSAGEDLAAGIVERGVSFLLPALANLATFADPELLVLGGGVSKALVPYTSRIEAYLRHMTPFPPRLAFSALGGKAGLTGAIRLAMIAAGA